MSYIPIIQQDINQTNNTNNNNTNNNTNNSNNSSNFLNQNSLPPLSQQMTSSYSNNNQQVLTTMMNYHPSAMGNQNFGNYQDNSGLGHQALAGLQQQPTIFYPNNSELQFRGSFATLPRQQQQQAQAQAAQQQQQQQQQLQAQQQAAQAAAQAQQFNKWNMKWATPSNDVVQQPQGLALASSQQFSPTEQEEVVLPTVYNTQMLKKSFGNISPRSSKAIPQPSGIPTNGSFDENSAQLMYPSHSFSTANTANRSFLYPQIPTTAGTARSGSSLQNPTTTTATLGSTGATAVNSTANSININNNTSSQPSNLPPLREINFPDTSFITFIPNTGSLGELPSMISAQQPRERKRRNTIDGMSAETAARNRCPTCQKQFKRPSSLKTHIYSHTGEKPFRCKWDGCGKEFSVRSNMVRHYKLHGRNQKIKKEKDAMKRHQQQFIHSSNSGINIESQISGSSSTFPQNGSIPMSINKSHNEMDSNYPKETVSSS